MYTFPRNPMCVALLGFAVVLATQSADADQNVLELLVDHPDPDCIVPGDTVTVRLAQRDLGEPVRGFQAFLEFDPTRLTFVAGSYTSSPFPVWLINPISADNGQISLAAGVSFFGGQPTQADATLVTLTFVASAVEGATTIGYAPPPPPTQFSDDQGGALGPTLIPATLSIDGPPVVSGCPADIVVAAPPDQCATPVTWTPPTATDTGGDVFVTSTHAPGNTFPAGTTTVEYEFTDTCGNTATCSFAVHVINELAVTVELSPWVTSPLSRCVEFELWSCDANEATLLPVELTFVDGWATALLAVPCGAYDCITARDPLHSLARQDEDFEIIGGRYIVDFTGDPAVGGEWLPLGNLNDDCWIDVLDFGEFAAAFGITDLPPDTTCDANSPHADINGDGRVDSADFTFIFVNAFKSCEGTCCGGDLGTPVGAISVADLQLQGLDHLVAGDVNDDGWLDTDDIATFADNHPRPQPIEAPIDELPAGDDGAVRRAATAVR